MLCHALNISKSLTKLKILQNRKRISVIAFIDSTETFLEMFKGLSTDRFKFRRFFTVVATKLLNLCEIELIFKAFWKFLIKHINLINASDNSTVELYTFMPFNDGNCSDTRPLLINSFDNDLQTWKREDFHPTNKTKNLYRCTLILGVAIGTGEPYIMARNNSKGVQKIVGIEKDIFVSFSEIFNFTIEYRVLGTDPGNLYENKTGTGCGLNLKI